MSRNVCTWRKITVLYTVGSVLAPIALVSVWNLELWSSIIMAKYAFKSLPVAPGSCLPGVLKQSLLCLWTFLRAMVLCGCGGFGRRPEIAKWTLRRLVVVHCGDMQCAIDTFYVIKATILAFPALSQVVVFQVVLVFIFAFEGLITLRANVFHCGFEWMANTVMSPWSRPSWKRRPRVLRARGVCVVIMSIVPSCVRNFALTSLLY